MMDMLQLAQAVAVSIAPYLPYLVKVGEKMGEGLSQKIGGDAWDMAKSLWAKLGSRIKENPTALEMAEKVANRPEDARAIGGLETKIEDILEKDPALAGEIMRLLQTRSPSVGRDNFTDISQKGDANIVGSNNRATVIKGKE